jgi:hypothetical protein
MGHFNPENFWSNSRLPRMGLSAHSGKSAIQTKTVGHGLSAADKQQQSPAIMICVIFIGRQNDEFCQADRWWMPPAAPLAD